MGGIGDIALMGFNRCIEERGGFSKRFLLDSCVAGVAHSPFSLNTSFSSQAPIRRNLPAPFPPLNLAVMYVVSMFHLFASLVRPM